MLKTLLTCFLLLGFSMAALAQTSDELKKKQADIQHEIDELRQTLNDTKKNKKVGLVQLAAVQKKLRLREQAINNISDQINMIQGTITRSRSEISVLTLELDTLKAQYEKSIVYAYKNRNSYDFLNFIFSANNFNDALKRIEYLKSYRLYREQQASAIKSTQALLQQKITDLTASRKEKDDALQKQEKEKIVLVEEKKEKDEIVRNLKSREKEISKDLASKQKADLKLRSAIKAAIDREIKIARDKALAEEKTKTPNPTRPNNSLREEKVAKNPTPLRSTPEGELISGNFEKNKGKMPWPVEKANIKIHFGTYEIEGTKLRGNNPGLTLETEPGAVVKAVFEGDVSRIFDIEGNWTVLVRHGQYFTVYSNLSAVSVSKDAHVNTGQMLGRAATDNDGNGEIEFLLMQENKNLDPETWIRKR